MKNFKSIVLKSTVIVTVLFITGIVFMGCPKSKVKSNKWHTRIKLRAIDNSGVNSTTLLSDSIYFKAFALSVDIADTVQLMAINQTDFFILGVYAFKKAREYNNLDTILSFEIKSLQKFNANFDKGSDLNQLFFTTNGGHQLVQTNAPSSNFYLFDYPDSSIIQQFFVLVKLSDGRTLSDTLKPIKFLK